MATAQLLENAKALRQTIPALEDYCNLLKSQMSPVEQAKQRCVRSLDKCLMESRPKFEQWRERHLGSARDSHVGFRSWFKDLVKAESLELNLRSPSTPPATMPDVMSGSE